MSQKSKITKVHNVVGSPLEVELEVNRHIKSGYSVTTSLMPWTDPVSNKQIFVQQVALTEENE